MKQTFEYLFGKALSSEDEKVSVTEDIAEWDYGDYEGMKVGEIRRLRRERELDEGREWSVWRDGCERGE